MLSFFVFFGCSEDNTIKVAHFSDKTLALSTQYTISVSFDEEKKLKEKSVDVQIKSSTPNLSITINKEGDEPITITLNKENRWYSLTDFFSSDEVVYTKFEDVNTITYILKLQSESEISFRAIAGQTIASSDGGQILANSEMISSVFKKNMKAYKQD